MGIVRTGNRLDDVDSTEWSLKLYVPSYQGSSHALKSCFLRSLKLMFKLATKRTKWLL